MWPFGGRLFPGTNLQDLNLDWIIQRVRDLSRGIIAPFINSANNHWMVWDTDAETFVDSGVSAAGEGTGPQGEPGKSPIIGSNGNWYTWNPETEAYTDTGITAQGPVGPEGPAGPRAGNNLLDNWYFVGGGSQLGDGVFPINRRGQTQYSGAGVTVDSWTLNNNTNVSVRSDALRIQAPVGTQARILQNLNLPAGAQVTISALVKFSGSGIPAAILAQTASITARGTASSELQLLTATGIVDSGLTDFRIYISGGDENSICEIVAAKIELGNAQTLARLFNDVWTLNDIPDWDVEYGKAAGVLARPPIFANAFMGSVTVEAGASAAISANIPQKTGYSANVVSVHISDTPNVNYGQTQILWTQAGSVLNAHIVNTSAAAVSPNPAYHILYLPE